MHHDRLLVDSLEVRLGLGSGGRGEVGRGQDLVGFRPDEIGRDPPFPLQEVSSEGVDDHHGQGEGYQPDDRQAEQCELAAQRRSRLPVRADPFLHYDFHAGQSIGDIDGGVNRDTPAAYVGQ